MSETKHTPGPWKVERPGNVRQINAADGSAIALGVERHYYRQPLRRIEESEETDANARLIAAAPELLEALKALKEDYADSEGCYCGQLIGGTSKGLPLGKCGYCTARAAIVKAEGR